MMQLIFHCKKSIHVLRCVFSVHRSDGIMMRQQSALSSNSLYELASPYPPTAPTPRRSIR